MLKTKEQFEQFIKFNNKDFLMPPSPQGQPTLKLNEKTSKRNELRFRSKTPIQSNQGSYFQIFKGMDIVCKNAF